MKDFAHPGFGEKLAPPRYRYRFDEMGGSDFSIFFFKFDEGLEMLLNIDF